jgi:predicted dehydrogenase
MKVVVIGSGAWGKNIVRTLHQMGELAAVVETSENLRGQLKIDYPELEIISNCEEIFDRADVSAVVIATPAHTHHSIAKKCLLAGKDAFVEKPITLAVEEAEDLVVIAKANHRILMVGHLLLYKPAVQFIRDFLVAGSLGKIFTFHQERMKLGKARAVENALWSLGVHDVAALLYLAGDTPEKVSFSGHCGLQENIEDDTYLHMTFSDGRIAHLHNSWLWPEDQRSLRVIGEKGMLVYDEKLETVTLVKKQIDKALNNVDEGSKIIFEALKDFQALNAEMQHFIDCVHQRKTPISDGESGLAVVRVIALAMKNTEDRK